MWTSTTGAGLEVKQKDDNTDEWSIGIGAMKHNHGGLVETFWLTWWERPSFSTQIVTEVRSTTPSCVDYSTIFSIHAVHDPDQ